MSGACYFGAGAVQTRRIQCVLAAYPASMRSIDLALYADTIAAEAAALSARLERTLGRLRRAAIEHEARLELPADVVGVLERRGLIPRVDELGPEEQSAEIRALRRELDAVELLQAWVEARLSDAQRPVVPRESTRERTAMR